MSEHTRTQIYRVSRNAVYKLRGEVESIVWSHNYMEKHTQKGTDGAICELTRLPRVVSTFQTRTAGSEHELLYERRVGRHPLHLRPSQRNWTCCYSVAWRKISNGAATKSTNVRSGVTEPDKAWIL